VKSDKKTATAPRFVRKRGAVAENTSKMLFYVRLITQ
jgi:hypothetical protein